MATESLDEGIKHSICIELHLECPAMNAIRRFLLRDSWLRRSFFCLVFSLLLLRAFLPGTVMLDHDAPEGSYGLVICSGFGPLFPAAATNARHSTPSMASISMGGMMMQGMHAHRHDATPADIDRHTGDQDASDSSGLCSFSAAFLTAIVSLFVVSLYFGVVRSERFWRNVGAISHYSLTRFFRPPSRGPPAFV